MRQGREEPAPYRYAYRSGARSRRGCARCGRAGRPLRVFRPPCRARAPRRGAAGPASPRIYVRAPCPCPARCRRGCPRRIPQGLRPWRGECGPSPRRRRRGCCPRPPLFFSKAQLSSWRFTPSFSFCAPESACLPVSRRLCRKVSRASGRLLSPFHSRLPSLSARRAAL